MCRVQLAQPYDAPKVLEIDPVTHTLDTFGDVGTEQCKWYGGVLAPNNKIYAIPYASQFVLEISPENRTASLFAHVGAGWGKWSGGVLAGNGKIYGIPSMSTSILEIDVSSGTITAYGHGMIPGVADKWNGGVLAPNGDCNPKLPSRVGHRAALYWSTLCHPPAQARSTPSHGAAAPSSSSIRRPRSSVSSGLSPQPTTRGESKPSISLACGAPAHSLTRASCFGGRHGGVCISNGRILAVPYNSAQILEIGKRVCMPPDAKDDTTSTVMLQPAPTMSQSLSSMLMPVPVAAANVPTQTFVLALPGCPDSNNGAPWLYACILSPHYIDGCILAHAPRTTPRTRTTPYPRLAEACFTYGRRAWHSVMITLMQPETTLYYVRKQVGLSHLSHVPPYFCFLFKGHALDPTVEDKMRAMKIAVHNEVRLPADISDSARLITRRCLMCTRLQCGA